MNYAILSFQCNYRRFFVDPLPDILLPVFPDSLRIPKRERTRRLLIATAIAAFSERGVAATSLQEIAAGARVTTGTVYNHSDGKADIVRAVALSIAQIIRKRSAQRAISARSTAGSSTGRCRREASRLDSEGENPTAAAFP